MISSLTKKNACRNSVSHPRVEESRSSSAVNGLLRRCRTVSGTERPLLSFPPGVFALRDYTTTYVRVTSLSKHCQSRKKPFETISTHLKECCISELPAIHLRPVEGRPPQSQRERSWLPCRRSNLVIWWGVVACVRDVKESMVYNFGRHLAVPG
jgi:hypothetical protein